MKKTLATLRALRAESQPIVALTAYDYPTALLEDAAGVDVVLVGDSVGTNILGYESEREVSMEDMLHHVKAVRRGINSAYILADLPYLSYEFPAQALENSRRLLVQGADGVKLEGAKIEIIEHLHSHGIEVCGHLGFTPQTAKKPGFKAKSAEEALALLRDALAIEQAGADWIVLETIPEEVAQAVTERLGIPTIGIGAGRFVSGQVLVVTDLLGISAKNFVHNKQFGKFREPMQQAMSSYAGEVRKGLFPAEGNLRHLEAAMMEEFSTGLRVLP